MTTFLGPVGSLIPVKCASTLTSSGGREVSFTRTLGKQKAFFGQVRAREWNVDIGVAKPAELSGLRWLAEYSSGPLVWYPPDAVAGNILGSQFAGFGPEFHNGLEGPLVEVEPHLWVKSAFQDPDTGLNIGFPRSGPNKDYVPVPVIQEQLVTISAWLRGPNPGLSVTWRDQEGASVQGDIAPAADPLSVLTRVHRTLVPPPGAVQMTILARATQVAGPAVTISDGLMPYSSGRGARSVVVHGLADAVIRATETQQLQSLSFTVSEVG